MVDRWNHSRVVGPFLATTAVAIWLVLHVVRHADAGPRQSHGVLMDPQFSDSSSSRWSRAYYPEPDNWRFIVCRCCDGWMTGSPSEHKCSKSHCDHPSCTCSTQQKLALMDAARFLDSRGISATQNRRLTYLEEIQFFEATMIATKTGGPRPKRPQEPMPCSEMLALAKKHGWAPPSGIAGGDNSGAGGRKRAPQHGPTPGWPSAPPGLEDKTVSTPDSTKSGEKQEPHAPAADPEDKVWDLDAEEFLNEPSVLDSDPDSLFADGNPGIQGTGPLATPGGGNDASNDASSGVTNSRGSSVYDSLTPDSTSRDGSKRNSHSSHEPWELPSGRYPNEADANEYLTAEDLIEQYESDSRPAAPRDGAEWTITPNHTDLASVAPTIALPDSAQVVIFSGGIQQDYAKHDRLGQEISNRTNMPVSVVYNEPGSFVGDVSAALEDRLKVPPRHADEGWAERHFRRPKGAPVNRSARAMAEQIIDRIDQGEVVPVVVFSEGAINLGNALGILSRDYVGPASRDLSNLRIVVLGGGLPTEGRQYQWAKDQGAIVSSVFGEQDVVAGAVGDGSWGNLVGVTDHSVGYLLPHVTSDLFTKSQVKEVPSPPQRPQYKPKWNHGGLR